MRFKLETGANVSKTFGKKIQKHKKLRKRAAKKGDIMNAIELLKADHDTVDRLFQKAPCARYLPSLLLSEKAVRPFDDQISIIRLRS